MIKRFTFILLILVSVSFTSRAQEHAHEYAPLQERKINYKDWTFNDLKTNAPVSLSSLVQGKKLVMVVYFAPWCPNWRYEAPVAAKLYEKYKAQGFEVIGVNEYGTRDEVLKFFGTTGLPYTVVTESETSDARDKTTHYKYRQAADDKRKWGSPFNVFLEPAKLQKTGGVLTEKAWVVGGELVEADADNFINTRLNPKPDAKAAQKQ
ncbi:MAG: TlpA disulfide reductase family protein [Pyrinomonadaceae bacterium]